MKTFRIAIVSLCVLAGVLMTSSTAGAKQPGSQQPGSALAQRATTLGDHTYHAKKLSGGRLLLKCVGTDGTRISVVVDPKGPTVAYSWSWVGKVVDWVLGRSPSGTGPEKATTCMRSTTTVKTKDGTEIKTTQETGNCPK